MSRIIRTGQRVAYYTTCPRCEQAIRFDHTHVLIAEGKVDWDQALFAAGWRMHFQHGCPASPT